MARRHAPEGTTREGSQADATPHAVYRSPITDAVVASSFSSTLRAPGAPRPDQRTLARAT